MTLEINVNDVENAWKSPLLWNAFDLKKLNSVVLFDGSSIALNDLGSIIVLVVWSQNKIQNDFWERIEQLQGCLSSNGTVVTINTDTQEESSAILGQSKTTSEGTLNGYSLDNSFWKSTDIFGEAGDPTAVLIGGYSTVRFVGDVRVAGQLEQEITNAIAISQSNPSSSRLWKSPLVGTEFDFTLLENEEYIDGMKYDSSLPAKTFLINFWTTWSANAVDSLQNLIDLKTLYGSALQTVSINIDQLNPPTYSSVERVSEFLKSRNLELVTIVDLESRLLEYFNKLSNGIVPTTVIVHRGIIYSVGSDHDQIQSEVVDLMKSVNLLFTKTVTTKTTTRDHDRIVVKTKTVKTIKTVPSVLISQVQ